MSHFTRIAERIEVAPLLAELDANPGLWNERPERRVGTSPHRETSDVWVRYASAKAIGDPGFSHRPHESVWWPASRQLPGLILPIEAVVNGLGFQLEDVGGPLKMGGILITRIPPGCQVYPHHDRGTWHAEHYTTKVWVVLRANDQCVNTVEDEAMVWKPGEGWSHDNLLVHSVRNDGESERLVLILCFRKED